MTRGRNQAQADRRRAVAESAVVAELRTRIAGLEADLDTAIRAVRAPEVAQGAFRAVTDERNRLAEQSAGLEADLERASEQRDRCRLVMRQLIVYVGEQHGGMTEALWTEAAMADPEWMAEHLAAHDHDQSREARRSLAHNIGDGQRGVRRTKDLHAQLERLRPPPRRREPPVPRTWGLGKAETTEP